MSFFSVKRMIALTIKEEAASVKERIHKIRYARVKYLKMDLKTHKDRKLQIITIRGCYNQARNNRHY